jgi:hypothetical protein
MRRLPYYSIALFFSIVLISGAHAQEQIRDTSIFKEHQVIVEKMDYIPSEREVKLIRILNNDTAGIAVRSDPYWISSMVSNKEYKDYLNAIKSSPVHYQTALPSKELESQEIKSLQISYKEYFNNSKYENYPVLGVSWNQAQLFCQWKTRQVNSELDEANLPHEKDYRLPLSVEIEGAKHFININFSRAFKENSSYNDPELVKFYYHTNELTLESFSKSTYLTNLSLNLDSPYIVIYNKASQTSTPYKLKNDVDLNVGFRYVQTYRKVPNSY